MKIVAVPCVGVDYAVRQYVFDSVGLFYDSVSTLIGYLDDFERMPGQVYLGVDCQFSLISFGDVPGGFLSQSITIFNDPESCSVRRLLLEQVDSTGTKILSDEWLVRMGWAYKDKNGRIVRLIDNNGRITGIVLWEMGFDQNGVPAEIVTIPQEGGYERLGFQGKDGEGHYYNDGVVYKQTSKNGYISQLEIVYRNLNRISDIKDKDHQIFYPTKNEEGNPTVPRGGCYERAFTCLASISGLKKGELPSELTGQPAKNKEDVDYIRDLLSLLDPLGRVQGGSLSWSGFVDVYESVAKKNLKAKTSVDREWSNRFVLLSLLGDAFFEFEGIRLFVTVNMNPNLLSATEHTLSGRMRTNTPFLRLAGGVVPQPVGVAGTRFDSKKPTIAIYDYANSILLGKSIIAIPVFKENTYAQNVAPDTFYARAPPSATNVPLVSREDDFYRGVDYYLLYEYDHKTGKLVPMNKPSMTNIYSKEEYVPASINEIAGFLKLMECMYSVTSSYEDISKSKELYVSPKFFVEQLRGMLFTKPVQALTIFRELGGFEALSILREFKPTTQPTSNEAYVGWFARTKDGISETGKTVDLEKFYSFQKGDYTPTSIDLFIVLLSITGAQRLKNKRVIIPITALESEASADGWDFYQIGSAKFYFQNNGELALLDLLGFPILKDGTEMEIDHPFSWLAEHNPKALFDVAGIRLRDDISPETVRQVFQDRILGLPPPLPEGQECKWFEKVAKITRVKIGGGKYTCYYSFANYILKELRVDKSLVESKQGYDKAYLISDAVRAFFADPIAEIAELRESLADEHFLPVLGIIDVYLLAEAYSSDSEMKAMNWFGETYNKINKFLQKVRAAEGGNIYQLVYEGFEEALTYVANKLAAQQNTKLQGRLLRAMIKMGKVSSMIDMIRPETATNPLAKGLFAEKLYQSLRFRLDTIRTEVDHSLRAKIAEMSGNQYVYSHYGMYLVAMLKHQGMNDKQIQEATGFTNEEINWAYRQWGAYCRENKVTEHQREKQFISVLQQICQGPTQKSFNALLKNGLMAQGTQIGVGGALGSLHILPFLTILGPVMQAIGFTAIGALEASTISPLLTDQNGTTYWGGALTRFFMNPDANILTSILMGLAVYLTDYMELGSGMFSAQGFKAAGRFIDMDFINVILAGMQGGMIDLGMGYTSEDTIADLMKPILGVVGLKFHPYLALGFEVAGLVSMLPQMDQFYKQYIWPAAKFTLGASLMGSPAAIITSAISNSLAMTALSAVEQVWVNRIVGSPLLEDVSMDFTAIMEYAPGFSLDGYDYLGNYVTHYVYGVW